MKDLSMVEFFTADDFKTMPIQWISGNVDLLTADDAARLANKALQERGVRIDTSGEGIWFERVKFPHGRDHETHTALLVAVQPIAKDTAEDVLRSVLAFEDKYCREGKPTPEWAEWVAILSRMRKVLGAE